ncbi:MAG: DNA repair protein RecO [Candidatus Taylorbacteria bacterium RIFCSPHIGHO2_01_FULL_51_15]|uniref:DNA repair protein RecO n=1 Tax=Candidatus Taylorbacteria bacterium RIFCSPHIGHO2_01_FULL_51_15 TaxID=1802304 RepID=A0A1G2MBH5_9BACT|nr:MAG: DNA repair protein RecO [Candidatus Taylorbacteria bacterium RIFCSPHIGHO2_01_FULL_51_15]
MSYHLYHTDALILNSTPRGEGSKILSIFTRKFGLIAASAQSVREERSKLRYGLQDFSYSDLSLVRGREYWRVTNAALIDPIIRELSLQARSVFGRISLLLSRLLAGEEKNEPIFTTLLFGLEFIKKHDGRLLEGAEIVLVLRILYSLGYLAPRNEFDAFLSDVDLWNISIVEQAFAYRRLAITHINHSLRQTQL